jgi:STE24 endopeptidase
MTDYAVLDTDRQQKAREYALKTRYLWLASTALNLFYPVLWLGLGWSVALRDALTARTENVWLVVAGFVLVYGAGNMLLDLPLGWYGGFVLPHRYDLSTQNIKDWWIDQFKGLLISAPLGLLIVELLYLALRLTGDAWWLWAAGGLLVFTVLLVNLAPVLIMPIFNKYVPLDEEHADLARRLVALAEKTGTPVRGVYKFDMSRRSKAANAALTGIGNTRRIVLGDTLIDEFTPDEIETVLAHELGHQVHRDMWVLILASTLIIGVGLYLASLAMNWAVAAFGFSGVDDVAAFPALVLVLEIYSLVSDPLMGAITRWRERMADDFALEITHKPRDFESALTRLANQNLGEVDPPRWVVWLFHDHPPLGERIANARRAQG